MAVPKQPTGARRARERAEAREGHTRAAAPAPDELNAFGTALEELFRAVLRSSGRGVPGGATKLTMSQYWVMDALADAPLTVSEVAHAARVAVPSATRALRALERRGFVERRRNVGDDGRHVTVALTRDGLGVLDEKRTWVRTAQRKLFESLTGAERRTAAGALGTISRGIDEL
jgi:MarR family transcriptional regulator, organic hydroperoxide resistance regulator